MYSGCYVLKSNLSLLEWTDSKLISCEPHERSNFVFLRAGFIFGTHGWDSSRISDDPGHVLGAGPRADRAGERA
jgi:hypothetical protein